MILKLQFNNKHEPNAIEMIIAKGESLGYVPNEKASSQALDGSRSLFIRPSTWDSRRKRYELPV